MITPTLLDRVTDVLIGVETEQSTRALQHTLTSWEAAAGHVKRLLPDLTITAPPSVIVQPLNKADLSAFVRQGVSGFAQLCFDLGLQEIAQGAVFYRQIMRTMELQTVLGKEVNAEGARADIKKYIDAQAKDIFVRFATTATNQNIGFHLLRCAFSLHARPADGLRTAAELIEALGSHRAGTPLLQLMDALTVQSAASQLPLFGKLLTTFVHSFDKTSEAPDDPGSPSNLLHMANSLGYILAWAQFSIAHLDDATDEALCSMMLNFMALNHPRMFENTPHLQFKTELEREHTPSLSAFVAAQNALLGVLVVNNGESAQSVAASFQGVYKTSTMARGNAQLQARATIGGGGLDGIPSMLVNIPVQKFNEGGIPMKILVGITSPVWMGAAFVSGFGVAVVFILGIIGYGIYHGLKAIFF